MLLYREFYAAKSWWSQVTKSLLHALQRLLGWRPSQVLMTSLHRGVVSTRCFGILSGHMLHHPVFFVSSNIGTSSWCCSKFIQHVGTHFFRSSNIMTWHITGVPHPANSIAPVPPSFPWGGLAPWFQLPTEIPWSVRSARYRAAPRAEVGAREPLLIHTWARSTPLDSGGEWEVKRLVGSVWFFGFARSLCFLFMFYMFLEHEKKQMPQHLNI